jgi:hypothetical protein
VAAQFADPTDEDEVPGSEPMYSMEILYRAIRGQVPWHKGVRAGLSLLECAFRNWEQNQEDFVFQAVPLPFDPNNSEQVAAWLEEQHHRLQRAATSGHPELQGPLFWGIIVPTVLQLLLNHWLSS